MGLINDWFGQDDEEFWASIPVIGDARQAVINIPDSTWNDIPIIGPAREAFLTFEDVTHVPAWIWVFGAVTIAGIVVWKVIR